MKSRERVVENEVFQAMVKALDLTLIQMESHWKEMTQISERSLGLSLEKRQGKEGKDEMQKQGVRVDCNNLGKIRRLGVG